MADKDDLDVGEEEVKSGGKKKLILIIVLVVVLLGGAAAAYFLLFSGSGDAGAEESAEATLVNEPSIYLSLDPVFVVDFMVDGRQRYVQLNMTVMSKNAEQVDAVKLHMPLIRNSLVLLFSSQSFEELKSIEGRVALKQASLDAINGILEQETGQRGMDSVLFTNFVMQ
ncbi:flagellar basal body-associated FliL family protein [Marinomonas sp. A79]|uniref:Flagellar protein FliL n=1 Tax=Marinomonas vulgaris TaxID=2823372 RepID=A0ABS5HAJ7_9GAMM|nr:flagellar basal body-associated FliL family protein [Marinomonas vulgaris]MBR7888688.1 flagellar basal body-associated FliL family protein [Marinomonas vulgaris]